MGISNVRKPARSAALGLTLTPLFLALTGCLAGGGGGSDANPARTGVFIDSPVAGLDYQGSTTPVGQTDAEGDGERAGRARDEQRGADDAEDEHEGSEGLRDQSREHRGGGGVSHVRFRF